MKVVGYVTTFIAVSFVNALLNGWTLSLLWAWFIVPTFELPEISIPIAIGMGLIVSFFLMPLHKTEKTNSDFSELMFKAFSNTTSKCLAAIGIGWIALQFV